MILVLEDEADILEMLTSELERVVPKNSIIKVSDGDTALDIIKNNKIELAILDIVVPGTNGLEILKTIREKTQIPVIMASALTHLMEEEIDQFPKTYKYNKPFSIEDLTTKVLELVSSKAS